MEKSKDAEASAMLAVAAEARKRAGLLSCSFKLKDEGKMEAFLAIAHWCERRERDNWYERRERDNRKRARLEQVRGPEEE